ncbi:MAG: poly(hydroxyalkanoate) granule-associated protein [Herpetosiphonaceae bacterium]|nr:MAG: poly(hydroxyalkanoate) granule-associated protein [Herpetosiphonaceae bacterium]
MSEEVEVKVTDVQRESEERGASLTDMVRRMMLAAVGAVAMSRDEMEQLVNKLVERGEIAEREGRQLIREVLERRKRQADKLEQKVESDVESRVEQLLSRLNIPTKRDIEELSEKIAQLNARIEDLKKSRNA